MDIWGTSSKFRWLSSFDGHLIVRASGGWADPTLGLRRLGRAWADPGGERRSRRDLRSPVVGPELRQQLFPQGRGLSVSWVERDRTIAVRQSVGEPPNLRACGATADVHAGIRGRDLDGSPVVSLGLGVLPERNARLRTRLEA